MGIEKQIASLETFFRHVNYPIQPLHYETKVVLDTFFEKGGFLNLCDLTFAGYGSRARGTGANELSWMDIGNSKPNGKVALALFRLLAPGGHLCNLLEAVSLPPNNFAACLKSSWKENLGGESDVKFPFYYFDMPMSALYASSYELLAEPADTNWYTLPRSRCPPMFLIPFWNPPLVTRFESDHGQVLTSLPCSPLAYFILRMIFYLIRKAEQSGVEMVCLLPLDTASKRVGAWFTTLMNYFRDSPCTELPLYHRLLTAYIQYFVSISFIERVSSKRALEDVQWSTSDVVAALLLSAPTFLCMRGLRQPELEIYRTPCREVVSGALVFKIIPFLTECVLALKQNDTEKSFATTSNYFVMPQKEICVDALVPSSRDVLFSNISFYRNTLIALRQSLISLFNFRECRREHFNNSLELWYLLLKPNESKEVRESYVVHHFEIYSFFLIDVFSMLLKSNFLTSIDFAGASMLLRCFEVFSMHSVRNVFREVNNTDASSRLNIIETITQYFTLNWSDEDGAVHVINVFGTEILDLAAEVCLAVEERVDKGDLDPLVTVPLKHSRDFLLNAFEGLHSVVEKSREVRASCRKSNGYVRASSVSNEIKARSNKSEEKELFFKGIRRSCGFSGPLNLRFSTENDPLPGTQHLNTETSMGNEFPFLVNATKFLDFVLEKLLESYYSAWIPTCSRGHKMWLLSSSKFTCINHPEESAVWECVFCEEVYGVCCRSNPYGRDGKKLVRTENSQSDLTCYCSECYSYIPANAVFYTSSTSRTTLCPGCASRPFKRRSFRPLAAYMTWTILLFVFILFTFFYNI
ncbi:uncharacterized protein Tco025E_05167 [Trypanosoma conorhini]|uniref:Uncharacterized protein n=1 Tax=Trypanosoma conorhini TaxID=83891 RepID=A0A3R7NCA9_9TRYP|nr:uncharacterized protein Tco025E_05167 [Trypanosoma conorhini]RNF16466.1 hypothetical protein Tco025E_05167 [Trypanosoma conorhini]